jgi:glycosyltransferase involved in cell wall biosynthesis
MRLLHVHSGNLYGGIETLLLNLARCRHFCPDMQPHFALCFEGQIAEELRSAGVPVCTLGVVRTRLPWTIWQTRMRLRDLLKRERFDVVVCHSAWSQAIFGPVVRSAELPLVFWLHGDTTGRHWAERWARQVEPDLAICNSSFTAGRLPNMYPGVRTAVVYPPVLSPSRNGIDRADTRNQLSTPHDALVIMQVSRMEPLKGHRIQLKALAVLIDEPKWIYWMVGRGQRPEELGYFKSVEALAVKLNLQSRIRFIGQSSDVGKLFAAADVYCQPNLKPEGFGVTFVEALNAGLPVVTSGIGGALEIVDDSCGILTSPNDPEGVALALRRLIQDSSLCKKLGAGGPARARQLCHPEHQLHHLNEALSFAFQGRSRRKTCA